jgi:hypothetical protein
MSIPFNLLWSQNGSLIHGYANNKYVEGGLVFPISFPSITCAPQKVNLTSSALANGTLDILSNIKFYLTGDMTDLNTVQGYTPPSNLLDPPEGGWPIGWPNIGFQHTPSLPQLNGGLQISFDNINWITFASKQIGAPGSVSVGDMNDASSWLLMPGIAVGEGGTDGLLEPFDTATFYLRYIIPPGDTTYKLFNISLALDCDII